jgi:branched-chain amino acid transport system permease protein
MDLESAAVQVVTGLASASGLFLVSCGLTIIFGVSRIVNFAHGSFYMLGAYVAVSLTGPLMAALGRPVGFWLALLLAALATGLVGVVVEVLLLRRIYRAPEIFQVLATFGVVLIFQDLVVALWGFDEHMGPRPPSLSGAVRFGDYRLPQWDLFLICAGPVVLGLLWLLFHRTRWGVLVRAATFDRQMAALLGINQALLFTGTFLLGTALAGFAGALQIAREPANTMMDANIITEAFVVTVVGGLGSVGGAFLAAVLIGVLQAVGIAIFPKVSLVVVFLVMAAVLVVRPRGLFGREEPPAQGGPVAAAPLRLRPSLPWLYAAMVLLLAAAPLAVDAYALEMLTEVMIFAVLAFSLNVIAGPGGMVSFGHAAFFGLGAYGAAMLLTQAHLPMMATLVLAPLVAGVAAAAFGAFIVRLSAVYLAMLSLAVAQIVWSVAFQWIDVTGGDNGIVGIAASPWARGTEAWYFVTLAISAVTIAVLWWLVYTPFGYGLRAVRDSTLRAAASGLPAFRFRWLGFVIAGAAAGVAGGLFAFAKGSIDPNVLGMSTSLNALVMILIGGVETIAGPLLGAAVQVLLQDTLLPLTHYWRSGMGVIIIALALAFPHGLIGTLGPRLRRLVRARADA